MKKPNPVNTQSPPSTPARTARRSGERPVQASAIANTSAIGTGPCAGFDAPTKTSSSPAPRQSSGADTSVQDGAPVARRSVTQAIAAAAMTISAETTAWARILHPVAGSRTARSSPPTPCRCGPCCQSNWVQRPRSTEDGLEEVPLVPEDEVHRIPTDVAQRPDRERCQHRQRKRPGEELPDPEGSQPAVGSIDHRWIGARRPDGSCARTANPYSPRWTSYTAPAAFPSDRSTT